MIGSRNISLFFTSIVLIFISFSSFAEDVLTENDVSNFQLECNPIQGYDIELKFAPVRKLSEESRTGGQWSYEFTTDDEQYPKKEISLSKDGSVRVDLILQLNRSKSEIEESYLWNVIVGPRVTGWGFGGYWPAKKPINEYQRLRKKRESLIKVATLSALKGGPVHTLIPSRNVGKSTTLNSAWIDIFGHDIVSKLVYSGTNGAKSGKKGHSLTFYHVPTPALHLINANGYRWPSFKQIDKPGKVFGFVLTPDGRCLASDSIDVVK